MNCLATVLRPQTLSAVLGQDHLVGPGMIFSKMAEGKRLQHVLLWGPPGTGKTSIAFALANDTDCAFAKMNATADGTKELKAVLKQAAASEKRTIVLVDEIHRWSKNVQDILLPAIENNEVTLIGLTVESARFAVNKALLSRCLVQETKPLDNAALVKLIHRVKDYYKSSGKAVKIEVDAAKSLINRCSGDARKLVLVLETLVEILCEDGHITCAALDVAMPHKNLCFDSSGNDHFDLAHCYQESIQHSDVDAAIYWLAKWLSSGEDPAYICRRMLITAFEDCASNPHAVTTAMAACYTTEKTGMPECMIPMALATVEMARSERDKTAFNAIHAAMRDVENNATIHVPPILRAGMGHQYVHAITKKYV